jgi:hypothetical protein
MQELRQGFAVALASVVEAHAKAWGNAPVGWARVDPIWVKAGSTNAGSALEMTATIVMGSGPAT